MIDNIINKSNYSLNVSLALTDLTFNVKTDRKNHVVNNSINVQNIF